MTEIPPSENPSTETSTNRNLGNRFGKRFYAIMAVTVIVLVVVVAVFFAPHAYSNAIPLSVDYQVGEEMVYLTTETGQANNNSMSMNSTSTLKVVSFDGEYYTLNHTITTMLDRPITMSLTEKINRTGYAKYMLPGDIQNAFGNVSSNPVLAALLSKPEAKVGDTWQIPLESGNATFGTTGNLTLTFADIEDITVPAGTYKVVKINVASDDLTSHVKISEGSSDSTISFSGSIYLEYGTCRQIKSDIQMNMSIQSTILNSSMNYSSQMTLTKHTKP